MFANRLARFTIGQKLGIAVGVSIIPVIVLTTLLVRAENKDIRFGRAEISGTNYLRAVHGVLAPILDHRRHADEWLAGNPTAADALAKDELALEAAIALLSETQARLGVALNTGEQYQGVVDAWTRLKKSSRASTTRDQNIEAHQALVAPVIALMARVGDTSNLVLDPDLDSYYLMDTVVAKLPALAVASTYAGDLGLVAAARKTRSQDDVIAFVKIIKDVESLRSGVQNNLKAAYANNPALQQKLSPAQDAFDFAAGAFTDQAEWNFVRNTDGRVVVEKFRDAANDTRASALALWDASAARLVELLEKRVHRFTSQLWWTLTSVGGVVAGALGFIAYIVVGITRGIKRASQVSERIAHGSLDDDIVSYSGDETGALLMSLRDMRNSLRDAQQRDREQAENARRHSAEIQKHADEMKRQAGEIQRRATETQRVKVALDSAQANVIIVDANFNIVYINKAATAMFSDAEADLRQELPNFTAARLMGQSIDVFHRDPSHQRRLLRGLNGTHKARIIAGKRTFEIVVAPVLDELGARLGSVVEWVDKTVELRVAAEEQRRGAAERKLANENLRIRVALDQVSTNVMLADQDNRIIYMNNAIRDMLREAQDDLRKHLSHFDVEKLNGALIDQFHENPAHQRQLLADLRGTYRTEITAGGRTFALVANPVSNDRGERLGSVVEWRDRTQEVAIEREVNGIVTSASAGDLTRNIRADGTHGFMKTISEGVNRLIGVCNGVLTDTQRVLAALACGDLTETIERDYQGEFKKLKDDANATVAKLTEVIGMVKRSSEAIRAASTEIMQGNQDLSQRTEEQASSLEETASSMEEMTGTVKQNADNARLANRLAVEARTLAEHGGDVVGRAVTAMEGINQSSKRIADIIGVIDGIAFQTNLLALNAAVEAARAGEQGRGFAVVATEVRNLAQRSAAAAREIKVLIKDSVERVEDGSRQVNASGKTLTEIVGAVKKVSDIIAEIAAASHEQSAGIGQVNKAIMQMDEVTQQNAALVEQAAAASEAMNEQAGALNEQMKFFKVERSASRVDRRGGGRPWSDRQGAVTVDRTPSRR